jgi:hypothetical protein
MNVRFYPLRPGEYPTPTKSRRHDQFNSPWPKTLALLERELGHLDAREVVISIAVNEDELRLDGWPKANAHPSHPGVIVSFESKHGPLRYLTDQFWDWQANLRAIALGLEALRAVDRYGITRRGEQYTGWKALTSGDGTPTTRAQAEKLIATYGSLREALFKSHPDHGGTAELFAAVSAARKLLEGP